MLEHFVAGRYMQIGQNKCVTVTTPLFLSILDCAVGSGHDKKCSVSGSQRQFLNTDFAKSSAFSAGPRSISKSSGKILSESTKINTHTHKNNNPKNYFMSQNNVLFLFNKAHSVIISALM